MAFTFQERALIRRYLGFSLLFTNANTMLENAMNTLDGLQDGGATQGLMSAALVEIQGIEAQISQYQQVLLGSEVTGEIKVDAARAIAVLRQEGTSAINKIAFPLSMSPARAYFYPSPIDDSGSMVVHAGS